MLPEVTGCAHLRGTWQRAGRFSFIMCENRDYAVVLDVDSPEAYALFEGGSGAVQCFGPGLAPSTPEDAERLNTFREGGLVWPPPDGSVLIGSAPTPGHGGE